MGGAIKDAKILVTFGDLGIENFERLLVAIRDDHGGRNEAAHRFVTTGEGIDEQEFGLL